MTYDDWKEKNWLSLCEQFEDHMAEAYTPRERIMISMEGMESRFETFCRQLFTEYDTLGCPTDKTGIYA